MLVVLQVSSQERAKKADEKSERAAPITFARLFSVVQHNHANNKSLRHVSDTQKFWKSYAREKLAYRHAAGDIAMHRASARTLSAHGPHAT